MEYLKTFEQFVNEAKGDTTSSGMMLINDLKSVQKDIDKLVKEFPQHKITVTDNWKWKREERLKGTHTLSYSGPVDDGLVKKLEAIGKKGNK